MPHLSEVLQNLREYGFSEDFFPVTINNHSLRLISNEGFEKEESQYIDIDIGVWCEHCESEHHVDALVHQRAVEQIRLVKLSVFTKFTDISCEP